MKNYFSMKTLFVSSVFLTLCSSLQAQEIVVDTVFSNSDSTVSYVPRAIELEETTTQANEINEDENAYGSSEDVLQTVIAQNATSTSDKNVGSIPFTEGMSTTGARTYSIPIITANNARLKPDVSLVYNSHVKSSIAGYGWSISCGSVIAPVAKSIFYDGVVSPPDLNKPLDLVFTLDNIRLIDNAGELKEYQYETSQGDILVKKHLSGNNIAYFTVAYPNGNKAIFGFPDNTQTRPSYPITKLVDIDGNSVDFEYTMSGNIYYISKISYGGTNVHTAEITFAYTNRKDFTTTYAGGLPILADKLLTTIVSKNMVGGTMEELRKYTLSYDVSETSRLARLDCSSEGNELSPLTFVYGTPMDGKTNEFGQNRTYFLSQYYSNDMKTRPIAVRGKLAADTYEDGLITLPGCFDAYTKVQDKFINKVYYPVYGSGFPADQEILVAPAVTYFDVTSTIRTGAGFQTVQAVDTDADGTDEIVRVNFGSLGTDGTTLNITKYKYAQNDFTSDMFSVYVKGIADCKGKTKSPISRIYLWGDFYGTGKAQLLTISHSKTFMGESVTSNFALIDLDRKQKVSETALFPLDFEDASTTFAIDINGDGKAELCHVTSSGMDVYALDGSVFRKSQTIYGISKNSLPAKYFFGDVNGDGLFDVVASPKETYKNRGTREIPVWAPSSCSNCGKLDPIDNVYKTTCKYCGYDLKHSCVDNPRPQFCRACEKRLTYTNNNLVCPTHGNYCRCDIVTDYAENGNKWNVFVSTGKEFVKHEYPIAVNNKNDEFIVMDINNDGYADLMRTNGKKIEAYLNSYGTFSSVCACSTVIPDTSKVLPVNACNINGVSSLIISKNEEVRSLSFRRNIWNENLLTTLVDSYGNTFKNEYSNMASSNGRCYFMSSDTKTSYPYRKLIVPISLLRQSVFTGAGTVKRNSYVYHDAVFHNTGLGFSGFCSVDTKDDVTGLTTTEKHDCQLLGAVTAISSEIGETSFVYTHSISDRGKIRLSVEREYETDKLKGTHVNKSMSYDKYGNLTHSVTDYDDLTVEQTIQYKNVLNSSNYILGLPEFSETRRTRNGKQWVTSEEISYNSTFKPVKCVSKVNSAKANETRRTYDKFGNLTSEMHAPYNVEEFIGNKYEYDGQGVNIVSATNEVGQKTTYSDFDKYGNAKTATDYKNRVLKKTFDTWGNIVSTLHPDGTVEKWTCTWGNKGLYCITKAETGKPCVKTSYDALQREVCTESERFDGKWLSVSKEYDSRGLLYRVSQPYKSSPTLWSVYSYDKYDRPVSCSEGSGKTTSWVYKGQQTTEVKNKLWTTRTVNGNGEVVKAEDAGGVIKYELRPDGQPESIVAPGNITTNFTYDQYGRKTSMADPSAGTVTYSYFYGADGTNRTTTTDAKGNVVQVTFDKYGHKLMEERPEFRTTYGYDSDWNVVFENSSNGIMTEYSYDNFGNNTYYRRTFRNKSVEKKFQYNNGVLSAKNIVANSGTAMQINNSENYYYKNGSLVAIMLNGNRLVWELQEENNRGQATRVETCGMERAYSYDNYGMPTEIEAGHVQSMSYVFAPSTGNLMSRVDRIHGVGENFAYDNLNRLVKAGNTIVRYSDNGNILERSGVGTFEYGSTDKPYAVTIQRRTSATTCYADERIITYNSFQCPASIRFGATMTYFAYDASGNRICMDTGTDRKYYFDEYEVNESGRQVLYIGGDAYTAPLAFVKRNDASAWKLVNICRDHLGSITDIVDENGERLVTYSYDAWGNMRNPNNWQPYTAANEPELLLGRGYTGHEHIQNLGLINMNARLYDPETGRFLSPDPYVQNTDFTQNFNRYSYCVNNPLKYSDKSGEFFLFTAVVAIGNTFANVIKHGLNVSQYSWKATRNAWQIDMGMFKGNVLQVINKWSYGFITSVIGNTTAHILNAIGSIDEVTDMDGMLALSGVTKGNSAFTIGHYSFGPDNYIADWCDNLFVHEYGHYMQSQYFGSLYFNIIAIPSLLSAAKITSKEDEHSNRWFEVNASMLGAKHFNNKYGEGAKGFVSGDSRFFDVEAYWGLRGNNMTKYFNPRTNSQKQDKTFEKKKHIKFWDFII